MPHLRSPFRRRRSPLRRARSRSPYRRRRYVGSGRVAAPFGYGPLAASAAYPHGAGGYPYGGGYGGSGYGYGYGGGRPVADTAAFYPVFTPSAYAYYGAGYAPYNYAAAAISADRFSPRRVVARNAVLSYLH